jgi:hypothetical protein
LQLDHQDVLSILGDMWDLLEENIEQPGVLGALLKAVAACSDCSDREGIMDELMELIQQPEGYEQILLVVFQQSPTIHLRRLMADVLLEGEGASKFDPFFHAVDASGLVPPMSLIHDQLSKINPKDPEWHIGKVEDLIDQAFMGGRFQYMVEQLLFLLERYVGESINIFLDPDRLNELRNLQFIHHNLENRSRYRRLLIQSVKRKVSLVSLALLMDVHDLYRNDAIDGIALLPLIQRITGQVLVDLKNRWNQDVQGLPDMLGRKELWDTESGRSISAAFCVLLVMQLDVSGIGENDIASLMNQAWTDREDDANAHHAKEVWLRARNRAKVFVEEL